MEDRRNDHNHFMINSNLWKEINHNIILNAGINLSFYKQRSYKVLDDLLGGDFYIDLDKFAEQDYFDPYQGQNDLRTPNRPVYEGDSFGYDYDANINNYNGFVQADFKYAKWIISLPPLSRIPLFGVPGICKMESSQRNH